jgi:hypothetical protein
MFNKNEFLKEVFNFLPEPVIKRVDFEEKMSGLIAITIYAKHTDEAVLTIFFLPNSKKKIDITIFNLNFMNFEGGYHTVDITGLIRALEKIAAE